jgi:hypothetical protein
LGILARVHYPRGQQPIYVAQYAPNGREPFARDPRQHAIGLTYALKTTGVIMPRGEAIAFEWFDVRKLPPPQQFGFGQDRLLKTCLRLLKIANSRK